MLPIGVLLVIFLGWAGMSYYHVIHIDNYFWAMVFAICFAVAFSTIAPFQIWKYGTPDVAWRSMFPNMIVSAWLRAPVLVWSLLVVVWALILAGIFIYLDPFTFVNY